MKKPAGIFLILIVVAVIVGAAIGIREWNKPHAKAENEAGIGISADSLSAAFNADEQAANSRFLNKVIAVQGVVREIGANADGHPTVMLQTSDGTGVFCTMREKTLLAGVLAGTHTALKGFCSGKTIDVITLTDCVIAR